MSEVEEAGTTSCSHSHTYTHTYIHTRTYTLTTYTHLLDVHTHNFLIRDYIPHPADLYQLSIRTHPHNLHLLQHTLLMRDDLSWLTLLLCVYVSLAPYPDSPSWSACLSITPFPPPPPLLSAWAGAGRARAVHRTHTNRHHTGIAPTPLAPTHLLRTQTVIICYTSIAWLHDTWVLEG